MSEPAVQVAGVTKRYGDFLAVDDVSFAAPGGVIYALLGPNGAGKTTVVRMLNDILVPDQGEIRLFGDLRPGRAAAARIGYLPEERGLYPKMRVGEVLVFFGELRGLSGRDAARRTDQWLERLGIGDWKKNKVQDLSKGMQQKVQFATALLHDPDLLILDEPWSGLDPINADVLREVVLEQKRAGKTILFSTHLMEQAEKICDEVCILARGRKALDGTLTAIKRDAASEGTAIVELADDAARARAADTVLADPALVAATRPREHGVEVELAEGVSPSALLAALVAAELPLRRFELHEPSLHQIFVDRVGEGATAAVEGRRAS